MPLVLALIFLFTLIFLANIATASPDKSLANVLNWALLALNLLIFLLGLGLLLVRPGDLAAAGLETGLTDFRPAGSTFLGIAIWGVLATLPELRRWLARWLPIEQLDQFDMEGTPVWVVLDFARRLADDTLHIYDWKTGKIDPEGNRPQLGCYTLYVGLRHDAPPAKVVNHLVYLGTDLTEVTFTLDEKDLEATKDFMRQSIARMKARLVDPAANAARREDFPLTDDLARCASCAFRRLCGRE